MQNEKRLGAINLRTRLVPVFENAAKLLCAKLYQKEIQNLKRGDNFLLEVSRRHYPQKNVGFMPFVETKEKGLESAKHEDLFTPF